MSGDRTTRPGRVIAVSGGIGAGKSVVSRLLETLGVPVFDCDAEARRLVDTTPAILGAIAARFGADVLRADGMLDRPALAARVFGDDRAVADLNAIVHPAVRDRLADWLAGQASAPAVAFETAILDEAGLGGWADEVWWVDAPAPLRLERVMARNGLPREAVESRMAAQRSEAPSGARVIVNDGKRQLIPQVLALLKP